MPTTYHNAFARTQSTGIVKPQVLKDITPEVEKTIGQSQLSLFTIDTFGSKFTGFNTGTVKASGKDSGQP